MTRTTVPYFEKTKDGNFLVGAHYVGDYPAAGPIAKVYVRDKDPFFHIITDPYEGHVMMNLEALPGLIKALKSLQRRISK